MMFVALINIILTNEKSLNLARESDTKSYDFSQL